MTLQKRMAARIFSGPMSRYRATIKSGYPSYDNPPLELFSGPARTMNWKQLATLVAIGLSTPWQAQAMIRFGCSQLVTQRFDP